MDGSTAALFDMSGRGSPDVTRHMQVRSVGATRVVVEAALNPAP